MPNRLLKDWTNSDKVNSISVQSERFFTRLIMKADDFGCFYADPRLLKANLFPLLLDNIREADLLRWMAECQKAGLIVLYEVQSKRYLQIVDFGQRLRQQKSKFPLPDNCQQVAVNGRPEEEEKIEYEVEEKEKSPPENFDEKIYSPKNKKEKKDISPGAEILYTIEHCLTVALADERWSEKNKASPELLELFNSELEGQGIYQKNPGDYKQHFFYWMKKRQNGTHQQVNAGSKKGTSTNRTQALRDW